MKIAEIRNNIVRFDNQHELTSKTKDTDFYDIDDKDLFHHFDKELIFEKCKDGFRFGNKPNKMVFVKSANDEIYYNGKLVLTV